MSCSASFVFGDIEGSSVQPIRYAGEVRKAIAKGSSTEIGISLIYSDSYLYTVALSFPMISATCVADKPRLILRAFILSFIVIIITE